MKTRHIVMLAAGAVVALATLPLAMAQNSRSGQTEPVSSTAGKQGADAQQAADSQAQAHADARAQRRAAAAAQKDQARKAHKTGTEEEEEGKPLR